MRVATGTISHEANTFAAEPTPLVEFETATDEAVLSPFDGGRSLWGIVETLRDEGVDIVPTVGADVGVVWPVLVVVRVPKCAGRVRGS